jgi:signal peptidase II
MNDSDCKTCKSSSYATFFVIALAVIICDQTSKLWISRFSGIEEGAYPPFGGFDIIPGFFSIVYATNTGAAWGMLSGFGMLLAALGLAALVAIYIFRKKLELEKRSMQIVFGLMCGGIIGNIFDRLIVGSVTDFLDFHIGHYRWPTFNVADSAMVVAACLYVIIGIFCSAGNKPVIKEPPQADQKEE